MKFIFVTSTDICVELDIELKNGYYRWEWIYFCAPWLSSMQLTWDVTIFLALWFHQTRETNKCMVIHTGHLCFISEIFRWKPVKPVFFYWKVVTRFQYKRQRNLHVNEAIPVYRKHSLETSFHEIIILFPYDSSWILSYCDSLDILAARRRTLHFLSKIK